MNYEMEKWTINIQVEIISCQFFIVFFIVFNYLICLTVLTDLSIYFFKKYLFFFIILLKLFFKYKYFLFHILTIIFDLHIKKIKKELTIVII